METVPANRVVPLPDPAGKRHQHVRAGAPVHRQFRALLHVVADGAGGEAPIETDAPSALPHVESGRLAQLVDQVLQYRTHLPLEVEGVLVEHAQSPQRRAEAEEAVTIALQVAEALQRVEQAENGAGIEARSLRQLTERQPVGAVRERFENGQRPFHGLDSGLARLVRVGLMSRARCHDVRLEFARERRKGYAQGGLTPPEYLTTIST